MNKDTVKGTVNDAVGRAKRQAGEWTGDTDTQVEGAAQQVKGKAQKAWGEVKDAAETVQKDLEKERKRHDDAKHEHVEHVVVTHSDR